MPGTDNRYPINVLYCYFLHYNFIAFQIQLRYYWVCRLFLEVCNLREINDSAKSMQQIMFLKHGSQRGWLLKRSLLLSTGALELRKFVLSLMKACGPLVTMAVNRGVFWEEGSMAGYRWSFPRREGSRTPLSGARATQLCLLDCAACSPGQMPWELGSREKNWEPGSSKNGNRFLCPTLVEHLLWATREAPVPEPLSLHYPPTPGLLTII